VSAEPRSPAPELADFLRDESRLAGSADSLSFPADEEEVRELLARLSGDGIPVTVQGARTGIAGGAVPCGGHVMNLSRMNRILGVRPDGLAVQPGVLLKELDAFAASGGASPGHRRFFPPDPTERTASLGGMAATNASRARSFHYGAMRRHVRSLRVALADGSVLSLGRGPAAGPGGRARGRTFRVETESGRVIEGRLPGYRMPEVKNAAGYHVRDDMDLVDLFIGSEGTLGVITEIHVVLVDEPAFAWGIVAFLPDDASAVRFVEAVRGSREERAQGPLVAVEYFDGNALRFLEERRRTVGAFASLPPLGGRSGSAIYLEYHGEGEAALEEAVARMSATLERCGGSDRETWFATQPAELARLRDFRHALPEAVNLAIDERRRADPALAKLGTDMAVPDRFLAEILSRYERDLAAAGLAHVKFGHIGDSHVHVNIIPENRRDYEAGRQLYRQWAEAVVGLGGTVSAEHGVGKLKRGLLELMYGTAGIAAMRDVKRCFDPGLLLGRGTMFDS
jgi:D-lactate dehydrogenase (cytochrome)